MTINIIVDISGSMAEMVKSKIERIALDSLVFYTDLFMQNVVFRVFLWNESFREADINAEIQPEGKVLFAPLAEYLGSNKKNPSQEKAEGWLLMSDGCWKSDELDAFLDETREIRPELRVLAIGEDADIFALERIAGKGKVFRAEDVLAAMELCFPGTNQEEAFNVE